MLGPCAVVPYDQQAYWLERCGGSKAYQKFSRQPVIKSPTFTPSSSSRASIKTSTSSKRSSSSSSSRFGSALSRFFSRRSSKSGIPAYPKVVNDDDE